MLSHNQDVKLQVWDTTEQAKYRDITKAHYHFLSVGYLQFLRTSSTLWNSPLALDLSGSMFIEGASIDFI